MSTIESFDLGGVVSSFFEEIVPKPPTPSIFVFLTEKYVSRQLFFDLAYLPNQMIFFWNIDCVDKGSLYVYSDVSIVQHLFRFDH